MAMKPSLRDTIRNVLKSLAANDPWRSSWLRDDAARTAWANALIAAIEAERSLRTESTYMRARLLELRDAFLRDNLDSRSLADIDAYFA